MIGGVRALVFDDFDDWLDHAYAQGWTDGFPVAPPEPALLDEMLAAVSLAGDTVLGHSDRRGVEVTVADAAWFAALAGCIDAHFPVVVAALQAFFDGIDDRDAPVGGIPDAAQAVIVNGPVRRDVQMNCGLGLFGPGWRANATIGRAVGLIARSSFPGVASFGDPAQYTLCFGEDEEATPWTPLHVERGFDPDTSTVTVHSALTNKQFLDRTNTDAELLVRSVAAFLRGQSSATDWFPDEELSVLVVMGVEYRRKLDANGWSKSDVRDRLYAMITEPSEPGFHTVPVARPDDLVIVAAGGSAFSTCWCMVSHGARPATRSIDAVVTR
jgi:hypothetical protein